jgi:hypothetical protein
MEKEKQGIIMGFYCGWAVYNQLLLPLRPYVGIHGKDRGPVSDCMAQRAKGKSLPYIDYIFQPGS